MTQGEIAALRSRIEDMYNHSPFPPTGCGGSFEELLCHEIHGPAINALGEVCENGLTFGWLAAKWQISLGVLGELIWDHCTKL